MKLSDYIVKKLEKHGVRHTFMVTGGGAMHLNDSFGKSKKIKLLFNHHEQASAIAAEGYARTKQQLTVVCVTTGPGVRLSHTTHLLEKLLAQTDIPAVTTFNGLDLLPDDSPYFAGRIGTVGQRAGNFTLQNADVILFLGTRNNIRQASYNWENFAKSAKKIIVDIDPAELKKPTVKPDLPIRADLKDVLPYFCKHLNKPLGSPWWLPHCQQLRTAYPPLREFAICASDKVHPYFFMDVLSHQLTSKDTVVTSNGTACVAFFQTAHIKKNQRAFSNSGCASMGYGLPAAIGACLASNKPVVCLEGDGSIMMNLQELQTVKTNSLPLKIFILKNGEYNSIIQTQRNFFNGRLTGCNAQSGVEVPDFVQVAQSFGLSAMHVSKNRDLEKTIRRVLATRDPMVCEVDCTADYIFSPKLSARKLPDGTMVSPSLEDMFPFLPREEYKKNLL